MKERDDWQIRLAWNTMWQKRCCPPEEILLSSDADRRNEHLDMCPFCRELWERNSSDQSDWSEFMERLEQTLPVGPIPDLQPGQIWSISQNLASWGPKKRYYQPPLVVVLKIGDSPLDAVIVAQIHDEPVFAGPGDIELNDDVEEYAETWNVYTLRKSDLDDYFGSVSTTVINRILEERSKSLSSLDQTSILYVFRNMEIETGYFFASQAISSLMANYDQLAIRNWVQSIPAKIWADDYEFHQLVTYAHYAPPRAAAKSLDLIEIAVGLGEGKVILTVYPDRKGILEGSFQYPQRLHIVASDPSTGAIIPMGIIGKQSCMSLQVQANQKLDIWFDYYIDSIIGDLTISIYT